MQTLGVVVGGLAILLAYGFKGSPFRTVAAWSQHLKGWQKILGAVSLVAILFLMINPEFLVLGLLGDTALVDLLVVALSLQIHSALAHGWRHGRAALAREFQWRLMPSPGPFYFLVLVTLLIWSALSSIQNCANHLLS